MGRKDQRRRRRQQSTAATSPTSNRAAPVNGPVDSTTCDDDTPTWEKRLEERAVRERWPMPPEMRIRILSRLMDIVDWKPNGDRFDPPSHRDINSAARTLVSADRLNVDQEKLAVAQAAAKVESEAVSPDVEKFDESRYAWYDDDCPCGLPPGDCKEHPRARSSQRPPEGEWTKWFMMGGRGSGKTKAGAEWVRDAVENQGMKRLALVGPTAADVRDVMVKGNSGILSISRPDNMPIYQPSIRLLSWPKYGAIATCYSADVPDRLRGPQHDGAWIDEPGAWQYGQQCFDMLMFGLRLGDAPRVVATSTPKTTKLIKGLVADPKVVVTRCTTYENRSQLAPAFFTEIITKYEGTRLGEQEINAQLIDIAEGAWFPMFSVDRHVDDARSEFDPRFPIRIAIDAGASRHTGAVFFQVRPQPTGFSKVTIFGEYLALDVVSADNASAIRAKCVDLCQRGPDLVRVDPAADQRTSLGPVAYNEYVRVFGERITARWPRHGVADGLGQIELMLAVAPKEPMLLVHSRCKSTKEAFQNYRRIERGGEYLDEPVDPQHPHEDIMDAVRGGIRDAMPEGRPTPSSLRTIHASRMS